LYLKGCNKTEPGGQRDTDLNRDAAKHEGATMRPSHGNVLGLIPCLTRPRRRRCEIDQRKQERQAGESIQLAHRPDLTVAHG